MEAEYTKPEFVQLAADGAIQRVEVMGMRGFSTKNRKNVIVIPISGIRGCHYEIALHKDCHEIALHFQGSKENNIRWLNGFSPFSDKLSKNLGYPLILGPHEKDRQRLWIKLPIKPLTQELYEDYAGLMAALIKETLPILKGIISSEM